MSSLDALFRSIRRAAVAAAISLLTAPPLLAQHTISTTGAWDGSAALPLLSRDFTSMSVGQTFTTPNDVVALNALTVFLGYTPFAFPNDLDLRFHAYVFGWNGTRVTDVLWRSPLQFGATDLTLETRAFAVGGVPMIGGAQYAFLLSTLEADPFDASGAFVTAFPAYQNVGVVDADSYSGGLLIQSTETNWASLLTGLWLAEPGADLAFTLQFELAPPATVPEPSTGLLLVAAVSVLLAARVRRRVALGTLR